MVKDVTTAEFKSEVLESEKPVFVDFWAPWCGPCRAIAPVIEMVAKEYTGKLKVVKVNVDENPDIASQLGVRSIPTLFIFKDGEVLAQHVGLLDPTQFKAWIDSKIS